MLPPPRDCMGDERRAAVRTRRGKRHWSGETGKAG